MFPKEKENYNHTNGWETNTLIHHKLYKNTHQQIAENPLSGFCLFATSFLNTLSIPREWQDQGKLTESYNQNTWWVGFGVVYSLHSPQVQTCSRTRRLVQFRRKKCEISNTQIQNLLNAETGTTQITKPVSTPHSYMNSLHIKVSFLLPGQGSLLALHPSALRKRHGNSRQDIQGTRNWLNSILLYSVVTGDFNREKIKSYY